MVRSFGDFEMLPEYKQFRFLAINSVYLMTRVQDKKRHRLYACHNFYLEIRYDETGCGIENMLTFQNVDLLEPYLTQIVTKL